MSNQPPKYLLRFFRWFCHPDYVEDIEGDLLERYEMNAQRKGITRAKWMCFWEVLRLLQPGIMKVRLGNISFFNLVGFYFKTGFRNLKRLNAFSIISSIGLSVALTAVVCIYQYITHEYNTDSFFSKKDKIFRLIREVEDINASYQTPTLAAFYNDYFVNGTGWKLARVYQDDELVSVERNSYFEDRFFFTDPNFFEILDYKFLYGNGRAFLTHPDAVVLSKKTSEKYFGHQNPIGKLIKVEGKGTLQVVGVLADQTQKSHLSPDLIAPLAAMGYASRLLESKDTHAFSYYAMAEYEQLPTGQINNLDSGFTISWQPLSAIYFGETMQYDMAEHGDKNLVDSLFWIGLLIVIITGVNFFNMLLTSLVGRIKDFGVRKVFGSNSRIEVLKVLIETYIIVAIAIAIATIGSYSLMKMINNWYEVEMALMIDVQLVLSLLGFSLVLTCAFACYPAVLVSSVNVSAAISKKIRSVQVGLAQEGVLTFQLATCMTLVVLCILITRQYQYLQQKELGLNPDQVVYFHSNNKHSWKNRHRIKDGVASIQGVQEVAMSYGGLPGTTTESVSYDIANEAKKYQLKTAYVSPNFLSVLEVGMLSGRNFDSKLKSEINTTAIVNEAAANLLGWPETNPIGRSISNSESESSIRIIGIASNFHFESFKKQIDPMIFIVNDWEETFIVKLTSKNSSEVIQQIAEVWKTHVPEYPFNYQFLDVNFQRLIDEDTKHRNILYLFSGLSLMIAISGLLSLSAYFLQSRQKEIAIRNVLGASISNQLFRFSIRYFKMLAIGALIALPLGWWLSHLWLSNFSYRILASADIFIYGISLVTVLIIGVQAIQVMRSVSVNPVENLKNE